MPRSGRAESEAKAKPMTEPDSVDTSILSNEVQELIDTARRKVTECQANLAKTGKNIFGEAEDAEKLELPRTAGAPRAFPAGTRVGPKEGE